jgi:hypothetical protein
MGADIGTIVTTLDVENQEQTRFSFMGDGSWPDAHVVKYRVGNSTTAELPSTEKITHNTDIVSFLATSLCDTRRASRPVDGREVKKITEIHSEGGILAWHSASPLTLGSYRKVGSRDANELFCDYDRRLELAITHTFGAIAPAMSSEAARGATVPPKIIKDHLDIWSDPVMEMLAGIYRIPEQLFTLPPPKPKMHAMHAD